MVDFATLLALLGSLTNQLQPFVATVIGILILVVLVRFVRNLLGRWDEVTVPVKYGCDHEFSREIFQQLTDGKDRLFPRTLKEVNAGNGRIPLASATFHLVETPVFDVRVVNAEGK